MIRIHRGYANQVTTIVAWSDSLTRKLGEASRKLLVDKYTWRRALVDTFAEIEKLQKPATRRVAL